MSYLKRIEIGEQLNIGLDIRHIRQDERSNVRLTWRPRAVFESSNLVVPFDQATSRQVPGSIYSFCRKVCIVIHVSKQNATHPNTPKERIYHWKLDWLSGLTRKGQKIQKARRVVKLKLNCSSSRLFHVKKGRKK